MRDEYSARQLQDLPAERSQDRAEQQVAGADLGCGGDPKAEPEQADVQQQRHHDGHRCAARAAQVSHAASDRGERDRDDLARPKHRQESEAAHEVPGESGPLILRHRPDTVHRVLDSVGDAAGAVQRQQDPDNQGQPGLAQPAANADFADDRVILERLRELLGQARIVPGQQVQDRVRNQQQREHRRECVVRNQRRQVACPIVTELLPGGDADGQPRMVLLHPVGGAGDPSESPAHARARLLVPAHGAALPTQKPWRGSTSALYDSSASTSAAARSPERTAPSM